MELRKLSRHEPCYLTDEEKLLFGSDMARANQEQKAAVEKKKGVMKQLTAEVEKHMIEVSRLSELLNNGFEYREVACELLIDPIKNWVTVTRLDTGEVIEQRPMRNDEAQAEMRLPDPGGDDGLDPITDETGSENTDGDADPVTEGEEPEEQEPSDILEDPDE